MDNKSVYQQISTFKQEIAKKYDKKNTKEVEEYYYYVSNEDAKDKALFISHLIKEKYLTNKYQNILDLAFGSANLTAHILLENNIKYKQLIFNDKNTIKVNNNIISCFNNSKLSTFDILNSHNFNTIKADLIIINPQLGGSYPEGDLKLGNTDKKVFEGLRKTLEIFLKDNKTILFYGKEKDFNDIFENKNYLRYMSDTQQLYVIKNSFKETICFEKIDNDFVVNKECKKESMKDEEVECFDDISIDTNNYSENKVTVKIDKILFSNEQKGNLEFPYKNILFKGVPGTGKSRAVDTIIEKNLELDKNDDNILRINIHSASSNSDLMQGIGISTNDNDNIKYNEKQGLILDIIKRATFYPKQPFVLILEEIQENSLNELIGDLIYLIEDDKRTKLVANNKTYESYEKLVDEWIKNNKDVDNIKIPYLVNDSTNYKKMIMPNNLFIFCTSNYRDDKKIIEDNLLRRFEVIEIYPNDKVVNDEKIREFFISLNESIITIMDDEIHPDRFMIGHAIWKDVKDEDTFYKSFSKLITEFKDIREIEFDTFKDIIKETKIPDYVSFNIEDSQNYYELIKYVQEKIKYGFIS